MQLWGVGEASISGGGGESRLPRTLMTGLKRRRRQAGEEHSEAVSKGRMEGWMEGGSMLSLCR